MVLSRSFISITIADFIVRSAYQMGKTPLLPLLALSLGATDVYLGFIVSVSTLTGMLLKPLVGIFSDRWGRRSWLFIGTVFFALMPLTYQFVHTPEQLFLVRIVHGFATAIYGPVTLAYIAEHTRSSLAEDIGWFSLARSASYVVGPAVAGWLLLNLNPVSVMTVVGILSSIAFLPIFLLSEPQFSQRSHHLPLLLQIFNALKTCCKTSAVWLIGGVNGGMYVALYAVKAFLPVYALSLGTNTALIGAFFAIQEGTHVLFKPFGGRLSDNLGDRIAITCGLSVLGVALLILNFLVTSMFFLFPSVLMGVSQALILPSTTALVARHTDKQYIGASLGMIGTMNNAGKVIGPVIAGSLVHWLSLGITFYFIAMAVLIAAVVVSSSRIYREMT